MDNKDWTPEELELKEALNKLYETDTREPSRPLDLSFMEEPAKEKMSKKQKRLLYIAAIVAIAFVSSFTTAVFISNDYASAVQDKIQRKVFEMKHGVVVATDEEFAEEGETVWEITDFEVAQKAKELVSELPIPGKLPEGYVFNKLELHLYNDGRYNAQYIYMKKNQKLMLTFLSTPQNAYIYSSNYIDIFETPQYILTTLDDPTYNTLVANIYYENNVLQVTSSSKLSTKEFLLIANNIY